MSVEDVPPAASPRGEHRRAQATHAVAAGAVFVASGLLARNGVTSAEFDAFRAVNEVPDWAGRALWVPMQAGSFWAPPVAAAVGWYVARSWRPTLGCLVAGWGGWMLAKGVKVVVDRGRPVAELGREAVRGSVVDGLGFVSGHATVAFACATVLAPYLSPRWRVAGYSLAVVVGLARMVVGAHLPLDVVGGAALGILLGSLWHLLAGVRPAR